MPETFQRADRPAFNYYGRWQRGPTAITINSGSLLEFAFTGRSCRLRFDVAGFTHFPAIVVQVDHGQAETTTLSPTVSSVAVRAASDGRHRVQVWVAAHSLYLTEATGQQWATLVGGCRFEGVVLDDGAALDALSYQSRQMEFLGDSITQGLRLLYNGADDDTGQQIPHQNWPQYVADLMGMKPVVVGFGGQGLTTAGTCGAPPAEEAFPYCFADAPWHPPVPPEMVVIYQGTNDPVAAPVFQERYSAFLRTVRAARPGARIVAICPHLQGRYARAIARSVAGLHDARAHFLDYATGVIDAGQTSDGCHLNPAGAVRLGLQLGSDLQRLALARV